MEDLIADLKKNIVTRLGLEDVSPEDIGTDDPLFVEGLGLDSIDAVELVVIVENCYGVKLTEMETARAAFTSVRTLADFITQSKKQAG